MTTEQRNSLWKLASFLKRDDGEGATTTSFPIDCKVLRVDLICVLCQIGESSSGQGWRDRTRGAHLDQVGVPCISRDPEIIVALLLESGSA